MTIQKEIRLLINEIAKDFDITTEVAREIVYYQFKYVRQEIEKGSKGDFDSYNNILLRYLGTFHASKGKIEHIEKAKLKSKESDNA